MTSSAPTASSATTTATATASSSVRSAAAVRTPAARAPSASKPVASQERRRPRSQSQRADGGGRGEPEVARLQRDQRAEQQAVDARAGVVDVAGEDHADRQRGDEQQPDRGVRVDPARALQALEHAAEADRAHQRGQLGRDAPRSGDDQPREGRGADRVRVERQPPQHDPGPEHAGDHRQQQDLDDPALDVGRREVKHRRGS